MAEYIEREKLLKDISETVVFTVRKGTPLPTTEMRGANKVIDQIKSAPTADVVDAEKTVIANTKSEAYKEFAERLKAIPSADSDVQEIFEERINNILNELVGGDNEN